MIEPNATERAKIVLSSLGANPQLVRAQYAAATLFGRCAEIRERIRELKDSSLTAAEIRELADLASELAELLDVNEKLREIGERIHVADERYEMLPIQCKAARTALGWGVRSLADNAGVFPNIVARFEEGEALKKATVEALQGAFEAVGLEFTNGDPGVSLWRGMPKEARKVREI